MRDQIVKGEEGMGKTIIYIDGKFVGQGEA